MDETLHANIFFFITSVAVVALTILWVVILCYVISFLSFFKGKTQLLEGSQGFEKQGFCVMKFL